MIQHVWLYSSLPLASAVCLLFLLKKLIAKKASLDYILLFSNLALINLTQSVGYLVLSVSIPIGSYAADAYLICMYFFFTHLVMFACHLSNPLTLKQRQIIYLFPAVLTLFHLNGWMVDGYRIEQNTPMHNDGPLAWCFDLYILTTFLSSVAVLVKGSFFNGSNDRIMRSKNLLALISIFPLIAMFSTVILLSTTKYAIPFVIVIPTITIYTALTYYYISRDKVIDLSVGLNFFCDRIKLAYMLLETHKTKSDLKTFNKAMEKQLFKEALLEKDYVILDTANYLEIDQSTLRKKIKEYGLLEKPLASSEETIHL